MKKYQTIQAMFFFLALGFTLGVVVRAHKNDRDLKKRAIDAGCAYYSPMTGEFEWGRIK